MASKKKWKKRYREQARIADELFNSNVKRGQELARIDVLLYDAEFPGPTIDAWVAQAQQFLQRLVDERGLVKKSSGVNLYATLEESYISDPASKRSGSTPDGEYDFLQPSDLNRLDSDATRG